MTDPAKPQPPIEGELPPQPPMEGEQPPLPPAGSEPPPPALPPLSAPAPERYPFWGYRDLVFLIAAAFVLLLVVSRIAVLIVGSPHKMGAPAAIAITFAFEGLWFVVLYGVIRLGYGRPFWRSLGWVHAGHDFWTPVGWGLVTAFICVLAGSLLPHPHVRTPMEELLKGRSAVILMGFFAVTLGPLFEELSFRGFLQPLLVRTFGTVGGVLLQAVPFALMHGAEYAWTWQQLILMLFAGSAFGWMRQRTGSTAASTYMHAAFNFVAFVGLLAQTFAQRN
jgi:membrane protease YdiL (CAAX protease family)